MFSASFFVISLHTESPSCDGPRKNRSANKIDSKEIYLYIGTKKEGEACLD